MNETVMLGGRPVRGFALENRPPAGLADASSASCSCAGAFWGGAFLGAGVLYIAQQFAEYAKQHPLHRA